MQPHAVSMEIESCTLVLLALVRDWEVELDLVNNLAAWAKIIDPTSVKWNRRQLLRMLSLIL